MDWTVYWFQGIACFVFASAAMFSGITGAALMLPWFILAFALLPVPEITLHQAIAAALFLETAAFSVGIYRYGVRRLIDVDTAKRLAVVAAPAGIAGALVSHAIDEDPLRLAYATMMLVAAWLLLRRGPEAADAHADCPARGTRTLTDASGTRHKLCLHGLKLQRPVSGAGGFMTGLISTGVGEVTSPSLILRGGFPVPVAAATSIVLVAVTNVSATLTHFAQFVATEGLMAIPWNLIVWGVPGMAAGALLGSHLQGRINEQASRRFFAGLFAVIGVTFLVYALTGAGA